MLKIFKMKCIIFLMGFLIAITYGIPFDDNLNNYNSNDDAAAIDQIQIKQLSNYRLPTNVVPVNYVIEISPYFVAESVKQPMTFDANIQITLRALEGVTSIVLHSHNLEIDESSTKLNEAIDTNTNIAIRNTTYDSVTHKYTINLMSQLKTTVDYLLTLFYSGKINNSTMSGFYRSTYEENGITKIIGTTQMEPTAARQVFPCFDEPGLKATFILKINRLETFEQTISNTKLDITEPNVGPNRVRDIFKRTPIMSTYLVAFIISEFKGRESVGKTFNVYARPDAYSQTEYSFNFGQRVLQQLNSYMNISYASAMEKLDMAALPDFSAGAMENWGLVTYREAALLYDAEVSTAYAQQRIATIIMHEQAHMWFGNLVTCDWWNHLWLNEGFARYFEYFGTAMIEPSWNLDEQFNIEQLHSVFTTDSLESTHPMTNNVNTPTEISATFDSISYNKGAAVIRMMEHLMGKENFKLGLNEYLRLNTFKTGSPEKLYSALQLHSPEIYHIATIMNTWTTQSGYPVVTVNVSENRMQLSITQKRFLLRDKNHNDQTKWEIPINYADSNNSNFLNTNTFFVLSRNQNANDLLVVELQTEIDWIIFNIQQTGYYRVNYDEITWANIITALKAPDHSKIHVLNRAQIIDDMMNLARVDLVNYNLTLSLFEYLKMEENYIPWSAAFNNWAYIYRRLQKNEKSVGKRFMLDLIENIYQKLGFDEKPQDTRLDIYNRMNILSIACRYGLTQCISRSKEEFAKFETTTYRVPVNMRPVVYCTAIAEGTREEWEFLWKKYLTENVAAEQVLILTSLGCTKDANILKEYIHHILSDSIRLQDKLTAFTSLYTGHEENVPIVLDYVLENYRNISAVFGDVKSVSSILSGIASRISTTEQIDKLKQFYTDLQADFGLSNTITESISESEYNLQWSNEHMPIIYNYMSQIVGSSATIKISSILLVLSAIILSYIF